MIWFVCFSLIVGFEPALIDTYSLCSTYMPKQLFSSHPSW